MQKSTKLGPFLNLSMQEAIQKMDQGQLALDEEYAAIESALGTDFMHYDEAAAKSTLFTPPTPDGKAFDTLGPLDLQKVELARQCIRSVITKLLSGEWNSVTFPIWICRILTREQIVALEARGLVFAGIDPDHKDGGIYVNDLFRSDLDLDGDNDGLEERLIWAEGKLKAIYATSVLKGVTGLH
ncbi:hypothetical protein HY605_00095, partial [Candidatus Peregrinibacteria bacterium]|nr:hypothetical protein [Candidatus Peregrinibacteria bacterium]